MQGRLPAYKAYVLRLWRSETGPAGGVRASLEESRSGERVGFGGLEELFVFLTQQVECETAGTVQRASDQPSTEEV